MAPLLKRLSILSLFLVLGALAAVEDRLDLRDLDISPGRWTPRQPALVAITPAADRPGATCFELKPSDQDWVVVDGPEIAIAERSRFCKDRLFALTVQAKTEHGEGYVLQVRLRQGRSGASYTRNTSPIQFWESAAELNRAESWSAWAPLTGTSAAGAGCTTLVVELWFKAPRTASASISLDGFALVERYTTAHLLAAKPQVPGGIFFAEVGAMAVEFVDPERITACSLVLLDENGQSAGGTVGWPGTAGLEIALPGRGFYTVIASADYAGAPTITARTTAAVVGKTMSEEVRRASRFGSMRVWGSGDLWRQSGANWNWDIGGIDLAGYTRAADGTISPPPHAKPLRLPADHRVIMTFNGLPTWLHGQSGDGLFPPTDWKELERLAEVFARANPDLAYFCPFNEPDAHWRGSAEEFVRFHQAIAAGVRRGNPTMKIYGPCLYSLRLDDMKRYAALGLLDAFDGMVMHAYVNGTAPEGEFMDKVQAFTAWLHEQGKTDWPLYITEFGWCSGIGDWQKTVSEDERARFAARSIALMATEPVDCIAYFCFMYTDSLDKPGYSMLYSDHGPTPTFVAFVTTLRWLSWTQRGDGRWFRLSPNLNLVVFDNGQRAVATAWSAAGAGSIRLPSTPVRVEDIMGRQQPPPTGDILTVGPNPLFCELPAAPAFRGMTFLPPVRLAPGRSLTPPWPLFAAAPEFTAADGRVMVSPTAKPGEYLLIGHAADDVWQGQPVTVLAPLVLQRLDRTLGADAQSLQVAASISSPLAGRPEAVLSVVLADGVRHAAAIRLEPNVTTTLAVTIPGIRLGQRYRGTITLELRGATPWTISRDLDQTVLVAPRLAGTAVNWQAIPTVEFADWGPWPWPIASMDCWAQMRSAVSERGLHLLVEVTDDVHWQSSQDGQGMWQEDSIQVAVDVDADQPWQPNNVGHGFNGHRILEYGVSMLSRGGDPVVWRYRADVPNLKAGCREPQVVAQVTRTGVTTRYEVLFPWPTLGLTGPPAVGSTLGFALLVNDADKAGDRHGLKLFDGIHGSKDPELFGRLLITAQP